MNKFLLITAMIFSSHAAFCLVTMSTYRWRNDDGNEANATWQAAENTGIVINPASTVNLRLRFSFYDAIAPATLSFTLQYAQQGVPAFTNVPVSGPSPFVLSPSPFVTDGNATARRLSDIYTGAFIPGFIINTASANSVTIDDSQGTEIEWVLKPGTTILPNTTYQFIGMSSGGAGQTNSDTAILTTAGLVAVHIQSFAAARAGKNVLLNWDASVTAGSDFEIEKSADGLSFSKIGERAPAGTAYNFLDEHAAATSLFYRLKLVDDNGSFSYSKTVKVAALPDVPSLSVYPNPANDYIKLRLDAPAGPVHVVVLNDAGETVKIVNLQSTGEIMNASANISGLTPGAYFIKYNNETVKFIKL